LSDASDPSGWIRKAQQDLRSARRLLIDPPELEDVAYHLQQSVEKAIKAALAAHRRRIPRGGAGHDVGKLAELIPDERVKSLARGLSDLTPWATAFRYPVNDPLTAELLPSPDEFERRTFEVEDFVETVVRMNEADRSVSDRPE
jgi:HEPN domain-containing protein